VVDGKKRGVRRKSKNVSYDSILNRILDEREGKEVDSVKSEACVLLSHIMYMMIIIIKIGPIFNC
jgi:hypothetical protein